MPVLTLIAIFVFLVTATVAQEGWQATLFAQSGQSRSMPQVPDPAAMQNHSGQAQYSYIGNYDLPPQQPNPNNQNNLQQQLQVTRQTQIPLPFKITPANQDKLNSVELVYSMDRGQNWYSYQHLPPTDTKFDFNAPEDGEYKFVFRAVYKTGEIQQFGTASVLVDTVPPKLTLDVHRSSSGEVTVEWTAEDAALKNTPPTVSLSYDSNATWMTLAVDLKNVKREGNRETGHVAFWPLHEAEAVEIRCELEDAAENREILTKRLVLKPSQNGISPETAMAPAADDTLAAVQPVPDITVMPPKPIVMNTSYSAHEANEFATGVASDNSLNDLLQIMGGSAPMPVSADVTQRYASNFSDMTTQAPANAPQMVGPNGNSAAVIPTETPPFPGKIIIVSDGLLDNGQFDKQRCIIVRWMPGGTPFDDSKVDLYRSDTKYGPWRPITFNLQNTGEHYWLVSAADMMPFYLRIDLRSTQGLFTDFTLQTISLPLSLDDPATHSATQQSSATQQTPAASSESSGSEAQTSVTAQ